MNLLRVPQWLALLLPGTGGLRDEMTHGYVRQVMLPRHGAVSVSVSLSCPGENCLRTNLLTKRALGHAAVGDVLEIVTDNPASVETIPFMLANYSCIHLATIRGEQGWKIYVKKVAT